LIDEITDDDRARNTAAQVPHFERLLKNWRPYRGADRAIRDMVQMCQRRGAEVGLILTPEGPANRLMYGPGCRERVTDYARGLATELRIPCFDARDWLNEEDFADSHHVIRRGAEKLTERLGRDVLGPMIQAW
jgi:hypothetical protein